MVSSLDFLTSIIASCVVFSILGFLSEKLGVPIESVAEKGQGLAFVVYPTALAYLPGAWIWAVLFFIMLFFLGLDSEFALLETALTAIYDGYPKLRNHKVSFFSHFLAFFGIFWHFLAYLAYLAFFGQTFNFLGLDSEFALL